MKPIIAVLLAGIGSGFIRCQESTESTTGGDSTSRCASTLLHGRDNCAEGLAEYNVFFVGDDYYNSTSKGSMLGYAQAMLNMFTARLKHATNTDVRLRVSGTHVLQAGIDSSTYMNTTGGWLNAEETEPLFKNFIAGHAKANQSDIVVLLTGRLVAEKKHGKELPGFAKRDKVCTAEKYAFVHDPPFTYIGYRNLTRRLADLMGAHLTYSDYISLDPPESTPYHRYSAEDLLSTYRYSHDESYNHTQCHSSESTWLPGAYGPHGFDAVRFCNAALGSRWWYEPNITVDGCKIRCEPPPPRKRGPVRKRSTRKIHCHCRYSRPNLLIACQKQQPRSDEFHPGPVTLQIPDGVPCDNGNNFTSTMRDWACPRTGSKVCFAGACNMTYEDVKDLIRRAWNTTGRLDQESCRTQEEEEEKID